MSSTVTVTAKKTTKTKSSEPDATSNQPNDNLTDLLKQVKAADNTCVFPKCKNRTSDFAIQCRHCNGRFCTTHGLPEVHGCGEAVRREEKRKFLHPTPKLSNEKHNQAAAKLSLKLKQMQFERKQKQGSDGKGKKK